MTGTPKSLKKLALRGATWTLIGYGVSQCIRLSSNLVLTRLLVPEMFGLMALVNTIMLGLQMFSDVGIGPSIVQNKRGDDPVFLNTAWTIQVLRGIGICLFGCSLAWPVSIFYGEPMLVKILPVSSLAPLISGFKSTSLFSGERRMNLGRLTVINLLGSLASITVMISIAMVNPSVWALVAGSICSSITQVTVSHLWNSNIRNRFKWDSIAAQALVKFGRWVFISTIMAFITKYGDRLVMGKFLSTGDLGIYAIAAMMAGFVEQFLGRVTQKVLFPLYSNLNHLSYSDLRPKVKKVRLAFMGTLLPILWIMTIFGPELIGFLYDPRYNSAGWMLQVLSASLIIFVSTIIGPFYMAYGNSFLMMKLQAIQSFLLLLSMIIGGQLLGPNGVIIGVAVRRLLYYPIQVSVYKKYSLWIPELDALGIFGSIIIISVGLWLKHTFLIS